MSLHRAQTCLVSAQLGRTPRAPWRIASRCHWGFPTTITSPSLLADGTPFPTLAWLTCPWLAEFAAAQESGGAAAEWAARAQHDEALAAGLRAADAAVRRARSQESLGVDSCASVGIAGQRDPLGVKCLHAHIALALVGVDDPIGTALLGKNEPACPDDRCASLTTDAPSVRAVGVPEEDQ